MRKKKRAMWYVTGPEWEVTCKLRELYLQMQNENDIKIQKSLILKCKQIMEERT